MKKIILLFLVVVMVACLAGCEASNTEICAGGMANPLNTAINGVYDWTSPDGVHYWIINSGDKCGMAPRHDSAGQLIID